MCRGTCLSVSLSYCHRACQIAEISPFVLIPPSPSPLNLIIFLTVTRTGITGQGDRSRCGRECCRSQHTDLRGDRSVPYLWLCSQKNVMYVCLYVYCMYTIFILYVYIYETFVSVPVPIFVASAEADCHGESKQKRRSHYWKL